MNFLDRDELFNLHANMCAKALDICKKKNHDYSKGHPFGNFMVAEAMQVTTAEGGIIVRIGDKLSRLSSVLEKGAQVQESIEDTCLDIINYAILLYGIQKSRTRPAGDRDIEKAAAVQDSADEVSFGSRDIP